MDKFVNHKELQIFGEVWLHGSRHMNRRMFPWDAKELSEGTDWDYAAQHHQPWHQTDRLANENGWVEVVDESYMDDNTAFVYEKIIEGEKVQVSLRQDLEAYKSCFTSVDPEFYFTYLWKGSEKCLPVKDRRKFWNSLYHCHREGFNLYFDYSEVPF